MIGTTLKFRSIKSYKLSTADLIILFVLISFLIGYLIGIILITNNNNLFFRLSKNIFSGNLATAYSNNFWKQTLRNLLFFLPFLACAYLLGTCVFGCAVIPAVCVFKGILEGLIVSYIYKTYALSGMGYTALICAPNIIFTSYILMLACRESLCFANRIMKNSLPQGTAANLFNDFKIYSIRYLFLLILSIIAALLNSVFTNIFSGYFNF